MEPPENECEKKMRARERGGEESPRNIHVTHARKRGAKLYEHAKNARARRGWGRERKTFGKFLKRIQTNLHPAYVEEKKS